MAALLRLLINDYEISSCHYNNLCCILKGCHNQFYHAFEKLQNIFVLKET